MKRFKLEDYQDRLDETNRAHIIVKNIFLKQNGKIFTKYMVMEVILKNSI